MAGGYDLPPAANYRGEFLFLPAADNEILNKVRRKLFVVTIV